MEVIETVLSMVPDRFRCGKSPLRMPSHPVLIRGPNLHPRYFRSRISFLSFASFKECNIKSNGTAFVIMSGVMLRSSPGCQVTKNCSEVLTMDIAASMVTVRNELVDLAKVTACVCHCSDPQNQPLLFDRTSARQSQD